MVGGVAAPRADGTMAQMFKWPIVGRDNILQDPQHLVSMKLLRRSEKKKKEYWCPCTQVCIVAQENGLGEQVGRCTLCERKNLSHKTLRTGPPAHVIHKSMCPISVVIAPGSLGAQALRR